MTKFAINMSFVYEATFVVEASSKEEAWETLQAQPKNTWPSVWTGLESKSLNAEKRVGHWQRVSREGEPVPIVHKVVASTTKPSRRSAK